MLQPGGGDYQAARVERKIQPPIETPANPPGGWTIWVENWDMGEFLSINKHEL